MQAQIILTHLSFSYTSAIPVLTEVSLALSPGWTGLVGPNGSGKTTLLKVLAGELPSDPSMLQRIPAQQIIRYCPQRVTDPSAGVREMAARWDGPARRMMGQLALSASQLSRWDALSPGERKRWQIAAALADTPDLLLLDEPTNHLDTDARALLLEQLFTFQGIGVVVSHDRDLLDALTTKTLRLSTGARVRSYAGSYTSARQAWLAEADQARESLDRLQSAKRKVKKRLDAARRSQKAAERNTSTGKRMKSVRDSDARSAAAKARAASGEQSAGREVTVLRREMDRAAEALKDARLEREPGRSVFILDEPSPRPTLIRLKTPRLDRGGVRVLEAVDLEVRRDTRAHLRGPNGSGKTTLMEELLRSSTLPPHRVLYLPQELGPEEIEENLNDMRALPDEEKGRLLQIVAALGLPPERLLSSENPSPGEARKLALAMGLTHRAWLLMLDEPTNHLDLPSIERLQEALAAYGSALILVSHDSQFARDLTAETWTLRKGRLVR